MSELQNFNIIKSAKRQSHEADVAAQFQVSYGLRLDIDYDDIDMDKIRYKKNSELNIQMLIFTESWNRCCSIK